MYTKTTFTAVCALLASAAFAGDDTTMPREDSTISGTQATLPSFASLDTNHDGAVSKAEAQNNGDVTDQFDALDTDRNGSVSSTEYSAATGPNARHGETDATDANSDDDPPEQQ
jgi:hypothetical protein